MNKQKVLVTGGAGYIGSHTIVQLINYGYEVVSVANYINSDPIAYAQINEITGVDISYYNVDLCDYNELKKIIAIHPDIQGIIHFAALKSVGESVEKPTLYFENNLLGLINVLKVAEEFKVNNFIFSSSCTVYGIPEMSPVTEDFPLQPAESPYGRTKQMGEEIIRDTLKSNDMQAILLRYFNPAGAHPSGKMGESPINAAANLVPAITETAIGKRGKLIVNGNDYNTLDGSCVRDYIHVMDLAEAHVMAMTYLLNSKQKVKIDVFNLGSGQGATVLEVIKAFEEASGLNLNYKIGPRRPGDVPAIYSNYHKAESILGWKPKYTIDDIMKTAWDWERERNE